MLQKLKVTSYALIILLLLVLPSQAIAICVTPNMCAGAAQAKGLALGGNGYAFSGSYETKGCYSYNGGKYRGMAFFGIGGSSAQMAAAPAAPKYRISCLPKITIPKAATTAEKAQRKPRKGFTQADYTSTYTPRIAVGPHMHRAQSTGGGNGDYIKYGRDKTQDWCERLLFQSSDLRLGVEVIHIQYSKKFCYYYGAVTAGAKNAGVGGPHIWTYALPGAVCHPNARVTKMYNTSDHALYDNAVTMCDPDGVNAGSCATGWGNNRCQWGMPSKLWRSRIKFAARNSIQMANCIEKDSKTELNKRLLRERGAGYVGAIERECLKRLKDACNKGDRLANKRLVCRGGNWVDDL